MSAQRQIRPTSAQLRALIRLNNGERIAINPRVESEAWWGIGGETIRPVTFLRLCQNGWIQGDGDSTRYMVISNAGRAEVSIASGAFRVAWPCGECGLMQPMQVKTYREIQRDGCGICCFECAAKAFVAGEQERRRDRSAVS